MSDLIFYTTEDGKNPIQLRAKDQTVWLSQREMAQLFDVSTDNVDQIITSNGFQLLANAGSIRHEQMESDTNALYLAFDQRRKTQEAQESDQQDEAELNALENKIKRRRKK